MAGGLEPDDLYGPMILRKEQEKTSAIKRNNFLERNKLTMEEKIIFQESRLNNHQACFILYS